MKLSNLATDDELETEGAWVDIGEGARIKVAYTGSRRFRGAAFRRANRRGFRQTRQTFDAQDEDTIRLLATDVLLDWDGIEDDDGNAIPYSPEKARELLTWHYPFREMVSEEAMTLENFRREQLDDAVEVLEKNSGSGSAPASTSASSKKPKEA